MLYNIFVVIMWVRVYTPANENIVFSFKFVFHKFVFAFENNFLEENIACAIVCIIFYLAVLWNKLWINNSVFYEDKIVVKFVCQFCIRIPTFKIITFNNWFLNFSQSFVFVNLQLNFLTVDNINNFSCLGCAQNHTTNNSTCCNNCCDCSCNWNLCSFCHIFCFLFFWRFF